MFWASMMLNYMPSYIFGIYITSISNFCSLIFFLLYILVFIWVTFRALGPLVLALLLLQCIKLYGAGVMAFKLRKALGFVHQKNVMNIEKSIFHFSFFMNHVLN